MNKAIEDDALCETFVWELENRAITHNLRVTPKTDEYYNQQELSYDYYDSFLTEILPDVGYSFIRGGLECPLWEYGSNDGERFCFPGTATDAFTDLMGLKITPSKLFRRIKDKVIKFGYGLESEVRKIEGKNHRVWVFYRATNKNTLDKNITEVTEVTEVTEITEISTEKKGSLDQIKKPPISVTSVTHDTIQTLETEQKQYLEECIGKVIPVETIPKPETVKKPTKDFDLVGWYNSATPSYRSLFGVKGTLDEALELYEEYLKQENFPTSFLDYCSKKDSAIRERIWKEEFEASIKGLPDEYLNKGSYLRDYRYYYVFIDLPRSPKYENFKDYLIKNDLLTDDQGLPLM